MALSRWSSIPRRLEQVTPNGSRAILGLGLILILSGACQGPDPQPVESHPKAPRVELGPRPAFLVQDLEEGALKDELVACLDKAPPVSDFSIGHRGAPLQFPEHTEESYRAAARMGAGILECDVTFTQDLELVCRHSQCDLHTTTDILLRPELASTCRQPFTPFDETTGHPASAECCTSDLTLEQFKSLCGKMDGFDPEATTAEEFVFGTPAWRTDLYSACGTVMSHSESVQLFQDLGRKMTPELKEPLVPMPFEGFSRQDYARKLLDEYRAAEVPPESVFPQSFHEVDIRFWLEEEPEFGSQAVFADGRYQDPSFDPTVPESWNPSMAELRAAGLRFLAPPLWVLLTLDENGAIVPSPYAREAKAAGLELITWTLERSGSLVEGGGWYFQSVAPAIEREGQVLEVLDVLAREVGVRAVFSDWPATTTFYAGCRPF